MRLLSTKTIHIHPQPPTPKKSACTRQKPEQILSAPMPQRACQRKNMNIIVPDRENYNSRELYKFGNLKAIKEIKILNFVIINIREWF